MALPSRKAVIFGLGLCVGFVISFILTAFLKLRIPMIVHHTSNGPEYASYVDKTRRLNTTDIIFSKVPQSIHSHNDLDVLGGPDKEFHFKDAHMHHDDSALAEELYRKVRVLCWVMTSPQNLQKKTIHVRATWSKRCNIRLFMSSEANSSFPTIGLNTSEGRDYLTDKAMRAFDYVADNHMDDADWFLKADDDTYVIMENLRYFLSDIDPNKPVHYGHLFTPMVKQGFYSGGGGYVLSKEALKRFRARDKSVCRYDGGFAEDMQIGRCLEGLGVKTGNSLDALGRSRFHCFEPQMHLDGNYPDWYYKYDANGAKSGLGSISDYAISFHYISPPKMYALEFYAYHLRPYGLFSKSQNLNVRINKTP